MKILLVTMDFPPMIGGIANYYANRVKKMPDSEIVILVNNYFVHKLKRDSSVASLPQNDNQIYYKSFFSRFIWPHWLPLIWQIYKIVRKEKITRLWVGQILPVGTAVWIMCWFFNHEILRLAPSGLAQDDKKRPLSFFVTCHGNDLLRAKNNKRKFWLSKKILKYSEFVEVNTEFTKDILIRDFGIANEKIKVVYPECTLRREQIDHKKVQELKEKYNLNGKKVLLTVARLVESKGIGQVIRALPQVWQENLELVYMIIGEGNFSNQLLAISEQVKPEKDKIIFVGAVAHNELPNYYALADVFILTPHQNNNGDTESFGIVYLEAMEFGLPVIAGDIGGAREAIGNYEKANFVNSENTNEIAEKIKSVLKK